MKTLYIAFLLLLVYGLSASEHLTIEKLKELNAFWEFHISAFEEKNGKGLYSTDKDLIRLHLRLVEKELRSKSNPAWSKKQLKNRLHLLDVLHYYWVYGLFPKNTGHTKRTPYFIDKYGTACAVGQLIIKSGYADIATKISRENNNGYITELVQEYPQIKDWASEHGFTIKELAWIQPCYASPVDTVGLKQPRCHNARDGYFYPDLSQLQGPLQKTFYRLEDTVWSPYINVWCGHWMHDGCIAGKYKWEVKDNLNVTHTYTAELVAPAAATVTILKTGDFNTCNGVISVSAQGGVYPYLCRFFVNGIYQHTSVLNSVCEQSVNLIFFEGCYPNGYCACHQTFSIETGHVGLKEEGLDMLLISPNPVRDLLQLSFYAGSQQENNLVKIYNLQGQLALETKLTEENRIDLKQLPPGLYFLQMDRYKALRFIKE